MSQPTCLRKNAVSKKTESILDTVQIAAPCTVGWDSMEGEGERVRFCGQCKFNVYNISDMSKKDAEAFLQAKIGNERTCLRLYRRADGTILTDDCPVGLRKIRDRARRAWRFVASFLAFLLCGNGALAKRAEVPGQWWDGRSSGNESTQINQIREVRGEAVLPSSPVTGSFVMGKPAPTVTVQPEVPEIIQSDPACGPKSKNSAAVEAMSAPKFELTVKAKLIDGGWSQKASGATTGEWQRLHAGGTETALLIVSPGALLSINADRAFSMKGKTMLRDAASLGVKESNYKEAAASLNNVATYSYYEDCRAEAVLEYKKALYYATLADPQAEGQLARAIRQNLNAVEKSNASTKDEVPLVGPLNRHTEDSPGLVWILDVHGSIQFVTRFRK